MFTGGGSLIGQRIPEGTCTHMLDGKVSPMPSAQETSTIQTFVPSPLLALRRKKSPIEDTSVDKRTRWGGHFVDRGDSSRTQCNFIPIHEKQMSSLGCIKQLTHSSSSVISCYSMAPTGLRFMFVVCSLVWAQAPLW